MSHDMRPRDRIHKFLHMHNRGAFFHPHLVHLVALVVCLSSLTRTYCNSVVASSPVLDCFHVCCVLETFSGPSRLGTSRARQDQVSLLDPILQATSQSSTSPHRTLDAQRRRTSLDPSTASGTSCGHSNPRCINIFEHPQSISHWHTREPSTIALDSFITQTLQFQSFSALLRFFLSAQQSTFRHTTAQHSTA